MDATGMVPMSVRRRQCACARLTRSNAPGGLRSQRPRVRFVRAGNAYGTPARRSQLRTVERPTSRLLAIFP